MAARGTTRFSRATRRSLGEKLENLKYSIITAELPPPQPKQAEFLKCPADVVIYGGSAGCGKTFAGLLMLANPKLIDKPKYRAVVFRNSYPEIAAPGGIWDESQDLYSGLGGKANQSKFSWQFPSGAGIKMSYLTRKSDAYSWKGAQIDLILFEELTEFRRDGEDIFWYLLTRARSRAGLAPKIRATTNPDADSWVRRLIDWWIGVDGYPIGERSGVVRWFIRRGEEIEWGNTREELIREPDDEPKSFTYIAGLVRDNPKLLDLNPGYIASLKSQHPVEMERLLRGNWNIRFEKGTFFSRTWFEVVDSVPQSAVAVRFWDLAATSETFNKNACYTAGIKMAKIGTTYYILDVIAEKFDPARTNELILATARQDGKAVAVRWEKEPGASGKRDTYGLMQLLDGFDAIGIAPDASKLVRAKPLAATAYRGDVKLLRAEWNDRYLGWLQAFPAGAVKDPIDASSGAYNYLSQIVPDEPNDLYHRIYGV